jgi:hypothetical protein
MARAVFRSGARHFYFDSMKRLLIEIIRFSALRILSTLRDNAVQEPSQVDTPVETAPKPAEATPDADDSKLYAAFKVANRADWDWKTIMEGLSEASSILDFDSPDEKQILDKIFVASDLTRQIEKCLMNQACLICAIHQDVRRIKAMKIASSALPARKATGGLDATTTTG